MIIWLFLGGILLFFLVVVPIIKGVFYAADEVTKDADWGSCVMQIIGGAVVIFLLYLFGVI